MSSWITEYVIAEDVTLPGGGIVYAGRKLCEPLYREAEALERLELLRDAHPAAVLWTFQRQMRLQ